MKHAIVKHKGTTAATRRVGDVFPHIEGSAIADDRWLFELDNDGKPTGDFYLTVAGFVGEVDSRCREGAQT